MRGEERSPGHVTVSVSCGMLNFIQFRWNFGNFNFQKISENLKNWENFKSGVRKNQVWCKISKLNEIRWYIYSPPDRTLGFKFRPSCKRWKTVQTSQWMHFLAGYLSRAVDHLHSWCALGGWKKWCNKYGTNKEGAGLICLVDANSDWINDANKAPT